MTNRFRRKPRLRLSRRVRRGPAGLAVLALTVAPGCGDDDSGDGDEAVTTTTADDGTSTPTTAELTPEEEAEAVYLELVDVVERLSSTEPDPDDEDLNRLATDPVLGEIRDNFATMLAENHRGEIGSRTSHRVMSTDLVGADTAIVRECYVNNDVTTDLDDGSIVDEGLSTREIEATLIAVDDSWVVSEVATVELFDGEVPCDE
jgi:hypothetical protein